MSFDNVGFITLVPGQQFVAGIINSPDRGAQYIGAHLKFEPGDVQVINQMTERLPNGLFNYSATFKNNGTENVSFTMTGGGFG